MKAEELMVGDWVLDTYTNKPMRIEGINGGNPRFGQDLEPISLTPEILAKNKFIKTRLMGEQRHFSYYLGPGLSMLAIYDSDFSIRIGEDARIVKYVHELQHLLRLCKIDKDIEL